MKAISLWQPWASLIAVGAKPYETRSWAPPPDLIGQPIAIHAAKRVDREAVGLAEDVAYGQYGHDLAAKLEASMAGVPDSHMGVFGHAAFPVGCVVAIARLDAAFHLGDRALGTAEPAMSTRRRLISRPVPGCFTVRIDDYGDYSPGRWAWLFREVRPLTPPVPAVGRQGFFDLPQGWLTTTFEEA